MTLYEQIQREQLTTRLVEDIYNPPLDKTAMLADLRPRVRRLAGRCAVRIQTPKTPVAANAMARSVQPVRQSKDRGS